MIKRTYVDSNVIISAFQSKTASAVFALSVLDDLKREFITSAFVRLETLPKPRFHGFLEEVSFIEIFFDRCVDQIWKRRQNQCAESRKFQLYPFIRNKKYIYDSLHSSVGC